MTPQPTSARLLLCGALATVSALHCAPGEPVSQDSDVVSREQRLALRALISGIAAPEVPEASPPRATSEEITDEVHDEQVMKCVYRRFEGTELYETLVSFDPNADSLWPGSVVQTRNLAQGLLSPISLPRKGGVITLTNASSKSDATFSRRLDSPTLATVTDALSDILKTEKIRFAAKSSFDARQVHSLNEAALKVGVSVEWMTGSVKSSFDGDWSDTKTSYVVKFTQNYYTVSFEAPPTPEEVFADEVTVEDAQNYMGPGNLPGYVASVSYGRMMMMKIESDASSDEIRGALNAAFSAGAVDASVDIDAKHKSVLENATVTVFAWGGDPKDAVAIMADGEHRAERLAEYLRDGAAFSSKSPGVPIGYTVRQLKDNALIKVASPLDYEIPNCTAEGDTLQLRLKTIYCPHDGDGGLNGAGELHALVYAQLASQSSSTSQSKEGNCTSNNPSGCGDLLYDAQFSCADGGSHKVSETPLHTFLGSRASGEKLTLTLWVSEDDNDENVLAKQIHEFVLNPSGNGGTWTSLGENYIQDSADNLTAGLAYSLERLK